MYMLSLFLLAATAHAVSLGSFTPRINQLPTQCNTAYRTEISGCAGEEFNLNAGAICSAKCVQGLEEIGKLVVQACSGVDVGETSVIGLFQMGQGIRALCPNNYAEETTTTSSMMSTSTSTSMRTSISTSVTTSTRSETSTSAVATSTSASTSRTDSARPSSTSSGLLVDPEATPTFATSLLLAPTQSSNPAKQTPNSQLSNANSGGGSPFDVVAMGASSRSQAFDATLAILLSSAALLFVCA